MSNAADREHQQLVQQNEKLRRAVDELSVLNEIATAISSTLALQEIIQLVVKKCVKHLNVEQAAVSLLSAADKAEDQALQTMVRQTDTMHGMLPYRLDAQLTGWIIKNRRPLLVTDLQTDERFAKFTDEAGGIRSLISVPLMHKGNMIGVLSVFNKKSGEFSIDDQRLLGIIATQSAQVIENARLLEEQQALLIVREEMRMARNIQLNLLPRKSPVIAEYDIAAKSIPAREVGGDFFDFIQANSKLIFCLGDGTGKGMPAAMLVANLQASIRSLATVEQSPKALISSANRMLHASTDSGVFATLFLGILDPATHTLRYCNAGHDAPVLINSAGERQLLETGGIVMGFMPEYPFEEAVITLQPGDRLLIYSDGITEAKNTADDDYGEERLYSLLAEMSGNSAEKQLETIVNTVNTHAGTVPQGDDMTTMLIRRV